MPIRLITGTPPRSRKRWLAGSPPRRRTTRWRPSAFSSAARSSAPTSSGASPSLNDGIVNVRFLMPSELAMELGERAMIAGGQAAAAAARRPDPAARDRRRARRLLRAGPRHPGPRRRPPPPRPRAARRRLRRRRASRRRSRAPARSRERPRRSREIFAEFLERRESFYGPDDCLLAAEPDRAPWGALFVFGLWQAPAELVGRLAELAERDSRSRSCSPPPASRRSMPPTPTCARRSLDARRRARARSTSPSSPTTALAAARAHLFTIPDEPAAEPTTR